MHAMSRRGSLVSDLHMPAMLGAKRDDPSSWGAIIIFVIINLYLQIKVIIIAKEIGIGLRQINLIYRNYGIILTSGFRKDNDYEYSKKQEIQPRIKKLFD